MAITLRLGDGVDRETKGPSRAGAGASHIPETPGSGVLTTLPPHLRVLALPPSGRAGVRGAPLRWPTRRCCRPS